MLSNKTQEALKVFLEGVKNETGMEVTDVKLYQHKPKEPSEKQMEQMKKVGFKEDGMTDTHWLSSKSKVKVDDVDIDFTCFYRSSEPLEYCTAEGCLDEPDNEEGLCLYHAENQTEYREEEEPLEYCTAEGCLGIPNSYSEDGLCTYHMEKQTEQWVAELTHQDYEYKQSKI